MPHTTSFWREQWEQQLVRAQGSAAVGSDEVTTEVVTESVPQPVIVEKIRLEHRAKAHGKDEGPRRKDEKWAISHRPS